MNQNAVEKKCCSIYSDVQEFFKTVKREPDFGFKVLNSPPIYRPRFLFIGYQPGGGCEDAINERDRGMGAAGLKNLITRSVLGGYRR